MKWTEDKWRRESYKSSVIGTPIAIMSLVLVAGALGFTILQLQNNMDTTNNLAELVDTNQEQTKALQETIKEIQHQTIVNAYANGGSFHAEFEGCSFSKHYDKYDNFLGTTLHVQPIIKTEKNVQTTVPFYFFIDYEFLGYDDLEEKYEYYAEIDPERFDYNFGTESSQQSIEIQSVLDEGKEKLYRKVMIVVEYKFRPFSDVKNIGLADFNEKVEEEFAIMEYQMDGMWEVLDLGEKYHCR